MTQTELIKQEIERRKRELMTELDGDFLTGRQKREVVVASEELSRLLSFIESMEQEPKPEQGYIETIYHRGKTPHWKVGDTLVYYETDGEFYLEKVSNVEFDEEADDWVYTFENGYGDIEEFLLEKGAHKKN